VVEAEEVAVFVGGDGLGVDGVVGARRAPAKAYGVVLDVGVDDEAALVPDRGGNADGDVDRAELAGPRARDPEEAVFTVAGAGSG
jgi:hypothetical protein